MEPKLGLERFGLDVQEIRNSYRTDVYFGRAKHILETNKKNADVLMQVFQKHPAVLCGVDEVIAILRVGSGYYTDFEKASNMFNQLMTLKEDIEFAITCGKQEKEKLFDWWELRFEIEKHLNELWVDEFDQLSIMSLQDGDKILPWETVMTIEGKYSDFAHLETLYLGVLARSTRIATNMRRAVDAARGKPVVLFSARFDHWLPEERDGYAAMVGGATGVSTDAQGKWWGIKGIGTMPHGLIAAYNGDTAEATIAFAERYPEIPAISLVDFDNNCPKTSVEVARAMKEVGLKLYGVRLDTSGTLVDESVQPYMGKFKPTGVCKRLVENTRKALDKADFCDVKIIVSGGFNDEKISDFETAKTPVDSYGVGSSILRGKPEDNFDFTADIVKPCAKVGRKYNPNSRLTEVVVE